MGDDAMEVDHEAGSHCSTPRRDSEPQNGEPDHSLNDTMSDCGSVLSHSMSDAGSDGVSRRRRGSSNSNNKWHINPMPPNLNINHQTESWSNIQHVLNPSMTVNSVLVPDNSMLINYALAISIPYDALPETDRQRLGDINWEDDAVDPAAQHTFKSLAQIIGLVTTHTNGIIRNGSQNLSNPSNDSEETAAADNPDGEDGDEAIESDGDGERKSKRRRKPNKSSEPTIYYFSFKRTPDGQVECLPCRIAMIERILLVPSQYENESPDTIPEHILSTNMDESTDCAVESIGVRLWLLVLDPKFSDWRPIETLMCQNIQERLHKARGKSYPGASNNIPIDERENTPVHRACKQVGSYAELVDSVNHYTNGITQNIQLTDDRSISDFPTTNLSIPCSFWLNNEKRLNPISLESVLNPSRNANALKHNWFEYNPMRGMDRSCQMRIWKAQMNPDTYGLNQRVCVQTDQNDYQQLFCIPDLFIRKGIFCILDPALQNIPNVCIPPDPIQLSANPTELLVMFREIYGGNGDTALLGSSNRSRMTIRCYNSYVSGEPHHSEQCNGDVNRMFDMSRQQQCHTQRDRPSGYYDPQKLMYERNKRQESVIQQYQEKTRVAIARLSQNPHQTVRPSELRKFLFSILVTYRDDIVNFEEFFENSTSIMQDMQILMRMLLSDRDPNASTLTLPEEYQRLVNQFSSKNDAKNDILTTPAWKGIIKDITAEVMPKNNPNDYSPLIDVFCSRFCERFGLFPSVCNLYNRYERVRMEWRCERYLQRHSGTSKRKVCAFGTDVDHMQFHNVDWSDAQSNPNVDRLYNFTFKLLIKFGKFLKSSKMWNASAFASQLTLQVQTNVDRAKSQYLEGAMFSTIGLVFRRDPYFPAAHAKRVREALKHLRSISPEKLYPQRNLTGEWSLFGQAIQHEAEFARNVLDFGLGQVHLAQWYAMMFGTFEALINRPKLALKIYGPKGNGKSVACKQLAAITLDGAVQKSGDSSARAKQNGRTDYDGAFVYHDEQPQCFSDQYSDTVRNLKEQITDGELVLFRTEETEGRQAGQQSRFATQTIRTHHQEKLVILSNEKISLGNGEALKALEDRIEHVYQGVDTAHIYGSWSDVIENPRNAAPIEEHRTTEALVTLLLTFQNCIPSFRCDTTYSDAQARQLQNGMSVYNATNLSPRHHDQRRLRLIAINAWAAVQCCFGSRRMTDDAGVTPKLDYKRTFSFDMLLKCIPLMKVPTPEICNFAWQLSMYLSVDSAPVMDRVRLGLAMSFSFYPNAYENYLNENALQTAKREPTKPVSIKYHETEFWKKSDAKTRRSFQLHLRNKLIQRVLYSNIAKRPGATVPMNLIKHVDANWSILSAQLQITPDGVKERVRPMQTSYVDTKDRSMVSMNHWTSYKAVANHLIENVSVMKGFSIEYVRDWIVKLMSSRVASIQCSDWADVMKKSSEEIQALNDADSDSDDELIGGASGSQINSFESTAQLYYKKNQHNSLEKEFNSIRGKSSVDFVNAIHPFNCGVASYLSPLSFVSKEGAGYQQDELEVHDRGQVYVRKAWCSDISAICAAASYDCASLPQIGNYQDSKMKVLKVMCANNTTGRNANRRNMPPSDLARSSPMAYSAQQANTQSFITPAFSEMMLFFKTRWALSDCSWSFPTDENGYCLHYVTVFTHPDMKNKKEMLGTPMGCRDCTSNEATPAPRNYDQATRECNVRTAADDENDHNPRAEVGSTEWLSYNMRHSQEMEDPFFTHAKCVLRDSSVAGIIYDETLSMDTQQRTTFIWNLYKECMNPVQTRNVLKPPKIGLSRETNTRHNMMHKSRQYESEKQIQTQQYNIPYDSNVGEDLEMELPLMEVD